MHFFLSRIVWYLICLQTVYTRNFNGNKKYFPCQFPNFKFLSPTDHKALIYNKLYNWWSLRNDIARHLFGITFFNATNTDSSSRMFLWFFQRQVETNRLCIKSNTWSHLEVSVLKKIFSVLYWLNKRTS